MVRLGLTNLSRVSQATPPPRGERNWRGTPTGDSRFDEYAIDIPGAANGNSPNGVDEFAPSSVVVASFCGTHPTETLTSAVNHLKRSGLDIVKSTETFDFSCAKPGRLPPDALLHLERLVTGLSAFADQRLPALRTRMQLHFVTTDKGGPVMDSMYHLEDWSASLLEPYFVHPVKGAHHPHHQHSPAQRLPCIVATTIRSAGAGVVAVVLSEGDFRAVVAQYPLFALGVQSHALRPLQRSRAPEPGESANMTPLSAVAMRAIDDHAAHSGSSLLDVLLMKREGLSVEVTTAIGASLVGYIIDFLGGVKKLRLLLQWRTILPVTSRADTKDVFLYTELSDACTSVLGVSFDDLWASWREYVHLSARHNRSPNPSPTTGDLQLKASALDDEEKAAADEAEEKRKAAKMTFARAYMWTIRWWLETEPHTAARCLCLLVFLGGWRVVEALLVEMIFSLAINAEAKEPTPGFSGNDTKLVAAYVGVLILGNLLASKANAQTIFDCPSGGGFIPWLKIQVAKHLCKVPQQHLDSLNVQSVLTVIEVDLKVINSNLDFLVNSLSTILQAIGVVISMFILKGDTFLLSSVVMLTIPLVALYDNFKSPQLMEASDRLLDFNVKIMTRIEEVLNLVNTRRVLGLHEYLDSKLEEEALAYQDGFLHFDQTTVSHSVVMQMFALFVKVTVKTFGAFQVASGDLSVSTYIAFSNSADGLMDLLVGDSGLAGVKRQFDVSCAPLTNLLKLQNIEEDPLQQEIGLDDDGAGSFHSTCSDDDSDSDPENDADSQLILELMAAQSAQPSYGKVNSARGMSFRNKAFSGIGALVTKEGSNLKKKARQQKWKTSAATTAKLRALMGTDRSTSGADALDSAVSQSSLRSSQSFVSKSIKLERAESLRAEQDASATDSPTRSRFKALGKKVLNARGMAVSPPPSPKLGTPKLTQSKSNVGMRELAKKRRKSGHTKNNDELEEAKRAAVDERMATSRARRYSTMLRSQDIKIRDLHFIYPSQEMEALSGISLTVRAGKKVCILGKSGVGKTTLVHLLSRVYSETQGSILVGKRPIHLINLHETVSIMQQETLLFDMSVRDNILIGTQVAEDIFEEACNKASIMEDPSIAKHGLSLQVGTKGLKVSLPLRERVSIARVLVRNTPIVVADAPASAQEGYMVAQISNTLKTLEYIVDPSAQVPDREKRPASVIALTQNLSLVDAKYDKICLMSDGAFVEKGTYAELMAKKGMLWLLTNNQEGLQTVGGQASISAKRLHNMWPFFAVSSSSDLATFQQLFSTVKLMEGEVLHNQGGECNAMFVLVEGSIDETLVDKSTQGKAIKIKIWSMGDSTGEEALFNDKFRWRTTAIAKSTSLLLSLPRSMFTNALNLEPVLKPVLEEGWAIIRQALAPSKIGFVWPFVGLPDKMLELIRKDFELEVLENDRDLFRQPEARCGALYVVIRGEMALTQRKVDGHGTLSLLNSKVKEGGVIGEVIPCATNPDMLRRASHVPLRAKSLTRTMVGKLTPSNLQRLFVLQPQMAATVNATVNVQQSLVDGSAIANHWVFAGVPMEVAQIIASYFHISVERQGAMLYNADAALNKNRVFFVIRGKVAVTNRNVETNRSSTVYAGAASLLNADALAAILDPVAPAIMPKQLLSLEAAELSVVASALLADVADILRKQEIDQPVHQSIITLSHRLRAVSSTLGLSQLGLGGLSDAQRPMVKSTQTVRIVDVGTNILASNLRSSFNPTFDADDNAFLFPNNDAGNGGGTVGTSRMWNQCVMLLQGSLSCVLGSGGTVKINEGSAFMTAGCQVSPRDMPESLVTDVVQATALLSPRVCVYVVFNLEALRPENHERVEKLWATAIQETRSREERKKESLLLHKEIIEIKRAMGVLPPFDARKTWRRAINKVKSQGRLLEDVELLGSEEMVSLQDELRRMKGLKNKRLKHLQEMLEEWEALLPALPDDPHDIDRMRESVQDIHKDHFAEVQGWLEETRGARLARAALYREKFDDLWERFPSHDDATVKHRDSCRRILAGAELKPLGASEWTFLEVELTDMRYLLTPTITTLVEQVKELCEELLYSESNQQLESVMRTAQSQPADEMILADLEAELRKLHVTAAVVRPLISAAQREKYKTVASLELSIKRREQAAYAAGAQAAMLEQKRVLEAKLGRLPQAERPPPLVAERSAAELAAELEEEQEDGGTLDSHVPLDTEIAGIREKAALWHTPASSTALQDAVRALSELSWQRAERRGDLVSQSKAVMRELGSDDPTAVLPPGFDAAALFQWERGLQEQRKQRDAMQARVVHVLAECEALWSACDVPKDEQARLIYDLVNSTALHAQEIETFELRAALEVRRVRHEEALADAATMARLRKRQELDRQYFAAQQIQAHVRGMSTRHSLNMTKELLADIRLKYKAIGRSAGIYRRFVQGLPSDVHLMKIAVKKHHANIKMYTLLKRQMRVGTLWTKLKVLTHEHESLYISAADLFSVNFTEEHMTNSTLMDATLEKVTAEEERLQSAWERKRSKGRGRAPKTDGPRRSLAKSKSRRKGSAAAAGGGHSDWDTEAEGFGLTDYATTDGEGLGSSDDDQPQPAVRRQGKRGGRKVARSFSAVSRMSFGASEPASSAAGSVAGSRAASAAAAAPSGQAESSTFSASPLRVGSAPRMTAMAGKGLPSEAPPARKVKSARVVSLPSDIDATEAATGDPHDAQYPARLVAEGESPYSDSADVEGAGAATHTSERAAEAATETAAESAVEDAAETADDSVEGEEPRRIMQTEDGLVQWLSSTAVDTTEQGSAAETRRSPSSERAAVSGGGEAEAAQADAEAADGVAEEATTESAPGSGDVVVPGSPPAAAWEEHGREDRSVPTTPVARALASESAPPGHSQQQSEELKLAEADSEAVVSDQE